MPLQGPASRFGPPKLQPIPPSYPQEPRGPRRRWAAAWGPVLPGALLTSPPGGKEEPELEGGYQSGGSAASPPDSSRILLARFLWAP